MNLCGISIVGLLLAGAAAAADSAAPVSVRIGAKNDVEGNTLGHMLLQLARRAGAEVEFKSLVGKLIWQALVNAEVDVYAEYTGTLTKEIFAGRNIQTDDELRQVLAEMGIRMGRPLGFNNPYALGMKEEQAERLGIQTISDLRRHPGLKFGVTNEFLGRADGWPNVQRHYQLPHKNVSGLEHSLAYRALMAGDVDVTDLYATDAEIRAYNLRVLRDDLNCFPAYHAVLLYRDEFAARAPAVVAALRKLEGRISGEAMTALNIRVQIERTSHARAAADFLRELLAIDTDVQEVSAAGQLLANTLDHLALVAAALAAGVALAVPLGVLAARRPRLGQVVLAVTGVFQTIPALALLVFMMALLATARLPSTGALPAVLALFLYSLLPVVRNTFTGLRDIPPQLLESAEALGLSPTARLRLVELPLAARTILAGIKTAAVISVGYATLGALINAGGYGQPILTGIQRNDTWLIIWHGAVPAAVMALAVQGLFELVERVCVPRGLQLRTEAQLHVKWSRLTSPH